MFSKSAWCQSVLSLCSHALLRAVLILILQGRYCYSPTCLLEEESELQGILPLARDGDGFQTQSVWLLDLHYMWEGPECGPSLLCSSF